VADGHVFLPEVQPVTNLEGFPGGAPMLRLVETPAPTEGRTNEPETVRGDAQPLHTATGIVIGGLVSGLFWGLVGVAAWLVI
jgi:hypothetical protein